MSFNFLPRSTRTVERSTKPWAITAAALAACLLAGCSTAQPAPVPTPISLPESDTPTPTAKATPSQIAQPQPVETPFERWPLSQTKAEGISPDDAVLDRPAIAVKIDNSKQAKPQTNIQAADVVFEEIVEGGVTRFMAVYQSEYPELVAPVRSGRNVDRFLVPMLSNGLIISGAAQPTYTTLHKEGIKTWEEGQIKGGFKRLKYRRAPHNLGLNLQVAGDFLVKEGLVSPAKIWRVGKGTFSELGIPGLTHPERISAAFSDHVKVSWELDPQTKRWLRKENGKVHEDTESGQIWADNVVFIQAKTGSGGGRDVSGNSTVDTQLVGTGPVTIASHEDVIEATWSKPDLKEPFVFTASNNVPVGLLPGKTWVELLPLKAKPELHVGGEEAAK